MHILNQLLNDEAGFIVSAELILVSTITVLALVVGLSEISYGVNQELEDVGAAVGSVNQTFRVNTLSTPKALAVGTAFYDHQDFCDAQHDIQSSVPTSGEGHNGHGWHY